LHTLPAVGLAACRVVRFGHDILIFVLLAHCQLMRMPFDDESQSVAVAASPSHVISAVSRCRQQRVEQAFGALLGVGRHREAFDSGGTQERVELLHVRGHHDLRELRGVGPTVGVCAIDKLDTQMSPVGTAPDQPFTGRDQPVAFGEVDNPPPLVNRGVIGTFDQYRTLSGQVRQKSLCRGAAFHGDLEGAVWRRFPWPVERRVAARSR
jgi:hypothetical protein